jgi:hypothetical protein
MYIPQPGNLLYLGGIWKDYYKAWCKQEWSIVVTMFQIFVMILINNTDMSKADFQQADYIQPSLLQ